LPTINDILKLLEDGKWHDLNEIKKKIELHDPKVNNLTKFLAQYNFIKLDKDGKRAKLDPLIQDFLKKIQQIEEEEARRHS
jgi:DNA-binding IclR family transcriptional regulator